MIYSAFHGNDEFVKLTDLEIDMCARFGMEMRKTSMQRNHSNHQGYNPTDKKALKVQALGAVCEGAICKAFGFPLKLGQQTFGVADLPGNIQVRLIGNDNYGLRVYPKDKDHWRVVGVIIPLGKERQPYRLPGWFYAGEAKAHPEWVMAPCGRPPMIVVPQKFLRPNSELRNIIRLENSDRLIA